MASDNRIGSKITTLRTSLGLSVEELAERSGCEPSTIERLESGDVAPSLTPLIKLTRALGVRLGTLLDDETELGPILTRRDAAEKITRIKSLETASDAGVLDFFSLASGKASRHMEPFLIDVQPAADGDGHKLSSHEGEEFLFVLEGARSAGITIGFFRFLRTWLAVTLVTLALSWGLLVLFAYHAVN